MASSYKPLREATRSLKVDSTSSTAVRDTLTLRRNDLLWVPREWDHEVVAVAENSVHLSFISSPMTVMDAISESLDHAQRDVRFRHNLTGVALEDERRFTSATQALAMPQMTPLSLRAAASLCPLPLTHTPAKPAVDGTAYLAVARSKNGPLLHLGDKLIRLTASVTTTPDEQGQVSIDLDALAPADFATPSRCGLVMDAA